jgi:NAD+ synthase (glutamine-hydrolysing)
MISLNGKLLAQGTQFSLLDVEVVTATVDLEEIRNHRGSISRCLQATNNQSYERIHVDTSLSAEGTDVDLRVMPTKAIKPRYHTPEEEIAYV